MIKNIVFDFGGVLVDWNPHHLYDPYFGSREKADWFLAEVCPMAWNVKQDEGRGFEEAYAERIALYPEWEKEIRMYYTEFKAMVAGEIPGMDEYLAELKSRGFHLYGLTNWSNLTFPEERKIYHIFDRLEGIVVSGAEGVIKPNEKIYNILTDRYGLNPAECIFIDDNECNVVGSVAAGWTPGITFKSCAQLRTELEKLISHQ